MPWKRQRWFCRYRRWKLCIYPGAYHCGGCPLEVKKMINPTGGKIRSDSQGDGHHGAPRGKRTHDGTDYECEPGQAVKAPHSGTLTRRAYPYGDKDIRWMGCVIESKAVTTKMFYLKPSHNLIGQNIKRGQVIGTAQDISVKYPGMTPHIHLRVVNVDPELLIAETTELSKR